MKKNNKGFSLVELIVVVLILGILAVAVTPQIMNWIDKSKENKDLSYAGSVATAVESVALEYYGVKGDITGATYYVYKDGVYVDGTDANATYTNAVTGQVVKSLSEEMAEVIAKFQDPENTDNNSFKVVVSKDATTGVVSVVCTPDAYDPAP